MSDNKVAAMISTLREELDETRPPRSPKKSRKAASKKSPPSVATPFALPRENEGRVRVIAEVRSSVGKRFKELCRIRGWRQKEILERFLESFVERHGS